MQIGAQLYSVRKYTQTLEDFSKTLKTISDIGYRVVQVSGTCAYDPHWLKEELDKNNLKCVLTHTAKADQLEGGDESLRKVVEFHKVFGCRNIGIGGMPGHLAENFEDRWEPFREKYVPIARRLQEMGAVLNFHNHYLEFQGKFAEKSVLDRILEDFPKGSVEFTLDLGWAAYAGEDVVKLIEKYKGLLSRIHLKDYSDNIPAGIEEKRAYLRPIYEGKLDYDAYIRALAKAGCEYMLVEQDSCYGEDEFDCLRRSYENVTKRFPEVK